MKWTEMPMWAGCLLQYQHLLPIAFLSLWGNIYRPCCSLPGGISFPVRQQCKWWAGTVRKALNSLWKRVSVVLRNLHHKCFGGDTHRNSRLLTWRGKAKRCNKQHREGNTFFLMWNQQQRTSLILLQLVSCNDCLGNWSWKLKDRIFPGFMGFLWHF